MDAFKKWEEIITSMDDGHFNEQDVTDALKLAGVKGTKMSFDQFVQAYEALQDLLEDYDDEEGDEKGQNYDPSDEADGDDESDDEVYSDEGESEEQSDEEFLRETFAELKDKKTNKVSVKSFYEWDEIAETISDGLLTKDDVKAALKDAGVVGKDLTLEQFSAAFTTLQDKLEGEDDEEEEDEEEDGDDEVYSDDGESEEQSDEEFLRETFAELKDKKTNKVSVKAFYEWDEIAETVADGLLTKDDVKAALKDAGVVGKDLTLEQFSTAFTTLQDQLEGTDESDEEEEEEDEQSDEELMREAFDELKDAKTKKVSAKAFTEWEEIAELVSEGLLTKDGVRDAIKAAGVGKDMSFEQFSTVFSALQDQIDENQEEADEDDEADTNYEGEDEEEDDEQSDEELMREAFDELKDAKTKKVSAKAFTEWEEIADLIKEGYLTKDSVKDALKAASVSNDMSFEQFSAVFSTLQDKIDAKEEAASKGTTSADTDDEEDDDDDMSYEEELETAFNTLKGKDGKVPKKSFQQWSVISDMLKDGSITQGDLKQAFDDAEITGNSLDFEEFIEVYEILDEFAYGADEDDDEEGQNSDPSTTATGDEEEEEEDNDEELTAELKSEFKQLTKSNKGSKTITIKTFKSWEPIAELIEDGILSTTDLNTVLKDLGVKGGEKGGELSECQFIQAYKMIEDLTAEYDDEEEDGEEGQNSDQEEEDDGEWAYEEKMNEYFDELKGKNKE